MKYLIIALSFLPMISFGQNPKIKDFKITILSTMLSDSYIGEWGFSAMIEVGGERIYLMPVQEKIQLFRMQKN
jgi:metal-dependent hydrolase (beta-lactamase superfamily II)